MRMGFIPPEFKSPENQLFRVNLRRPPTVLGGWKRDVAGCRSSGHGVWRDGMHPAADGWRLHERVYHGGLASAASMPIVDELSVR
jgi:hypothetical protein